jgi:hypothetical protein
MLASHATAPAAPVQASGVKDEAGAARYAAFEAPPYRAIRTQPFDAHELSELWAGA